MLKFSIFYLLALSLSACSSPRPSLEKSEDRRETPLLPNAAPSPVPGLYHSIYLGFSPKGMKRPDFTKTLNKKVLPLFAKVPAKELIAYSAVVPENPKPCALPNEITLSSFPNEASFIKHRDSKLGKKIRSASNLAFTSELSKNVVPEPLIDTIHFGHAYFLNPGIHDYRKQASAVIVHCDPFLQGDELRLELVKAYAGGTASTDIVFAVNSNYVVEFLFFPNKEDAKSRLAERDERFSKIFREARTVLLPKKKIGKAKLTVGAGFTAIIGKSNK